MVTQESHNRAPNNGAVEYDEATIAALMATLGGTLNGNTNDITNVGAFDADSAAVASAPSTATDVARQAEVAAKAGAPHDNTDHSTIAATRDLLPEGGQTGLVADATGVQYTGAVYQQIDASILDDNRSLYVEAATVSSAGDEEVTVEVYDGDAGVVAGSVAITGGATRARSADLSDGLTAGNDVYVRFNVTTASATGGATFDALAARLVID